MILPKLTPPMRGRGIWIGKILIHVNFANTFIWSEQNEDKSEQKSYILSIYIIDKVIDQDIARALSIIVGPFKLMIGW